MSHDINATASGELAAEASAEGKPAWTLVADAPAPDAPSAPDRAGRARGMLLLLVAGGLFWAVVAAVVFALR